MPSIQESFNEMRELRSEELSLKGQDPGDTKRHHLYSPATPSELDAHESACKAQYPPSFREFLSISNGWLGFWPDWSLVGVPREDNRDAYDDIAATVSIIPDELNESQQTALKEQEKGDPSRILATNHMIFATDFNGGLMVFDRNRIDAAGEMERSCDADMIT